MSKDDEKISAWIDGALDPAEAAKMTALANDEERIANRASRLRQIDGLVKAAVPLEPVPQELLQRLGLNGSPEPEVIDFAAAKAKREAARTALHARKPLFFENFRNIAAVLALGVLGVSTLGWMNQPGRQTSDAPYTALGNMPATHSAANVLVVFDSTVDAREARAIAASLGASVEGGRTSGGGWKLAFAPAQRSQAVDALRKRGDVRMAEPLEGTM